MAVLSGWVRARGRIAINTLRSIRHQSRLKIAVISTAAVLLSGGLFYVPYRAFLFLQSFADGGTLMVDRLLYLFFMGLFVMLVFSNLVISYAAHYRARETVFLFTLPLSAARVFFMKFVDTAVMSSWMFICFLYPVISAYARVRAVAWYVYPLLLVFFLPLAVIAAVVGCLLCLVLVLVVRRWMLRLLPYVLAVGAVGAVFRLIARGRAVAGNGSDMTFLLTSVIPHFGFSQQPLSPHYWLSEALVRLIGNQPRESVFWLLLLVSNALFGALLIVCCGAVAYPRAWYRRDTLFESRRRVNGRGLTARLLAFIPGVSPPLRSLVIKDLTVLRRDPLQWSQFLIFFGLLGIYFANIRTLGYGDLMPFWRNIVAFMNLASTNLTLASLSVRFVFPQLSMEGRRFWILGMTPLSAGQIILEKFVLNAGIALVICVPLIVLSNSMLGVTGVIVPLGIGVTVMMCLTLTGICVGLGALFPNMQADNPAAVVSGFGGTLALVLCLFYIFVMIMTLAVFFHLRLSGAEAATARLLPVLLFGLGAASVGIAAWSLSAGAGALRRQEF